MSCLLWNPEVHYRVHKSPPLVLLSQMHQFNTFTLSFPKIHSNIYVPICTYIFRVVFPSGFPTKMLDAFFIFPICVSYTAHLVLLDLITLIIFGIYTHTRRQNI